MNSTPFVPKCDTPLPYEIEFNKKITEFLSLLKSIDFEKFREQNYVKLDDATLLRIEDLIIELSKPEYKIFLDSMEIPSRPSKPKDCDEVEYNKKLEDIDFEIKSRNYIKELIRIYSIYHSHKSRKYFLALATHIKATYNSMHPSETIILEGRFKSPEGLISKLAKNIFISNSAYFETYQDPQTKKSKDIFHFEPLHDVFAFKIIVENGFSPTKSQNEKVIPLINKREELIQTLDDFYVFQEQLTYNKDTVTNEQYLDLCIQLLNDFIPTFSSTEAKDYYTSKKNELLKMRARLEKRDLLTSFPLHEKLKAGIKDNTIIDFNKYFNRYLERINAHLYLYGLETGINSILNNPNDETKLFQLRSSQIEEKSTSSGHEGIHYDISTPYGIIELQLQTKGQAYADKYRPGTSHSLIPGKLLPDFEIPKCYTEKFVRENPTIKFKEAIDSDGISYYYKEDDLTNFKRKLELYTGKKFTISDDSSFESKTPICQLCSSLENYRSTVLELPKDTDNKEIAELREDYEWTCTELEKKSGAIKELFFHYPNPRSFTIGSNQIREIINACNFSAGKDTFPARV